MLKDKKAVEKSNKDEVFKYHIAKVDESDYAVEEEPEITNEDFVLAIRPEALKLSGTARSHPRSTVQCRPAWNLP